ncbi:MAG TPA: nucleotide exchange factor GrpE [Phycisphaerae bacterium]|nr:nucleotide exchange factor GrpE [Phycisphaerae bacterium]
MRHKKDNISVDNITVTAPEEVGHFAADVDAADPQKPADVESTAESSTPPRDASIETIESLRIERDQLRDKLLRAQAECANIPKRLHQQHSEALKLAGMGLVRELLPIADNFERSIASMTAEHEKDTVIAGIKLIADQLYKVLRDHGVEPIDAVGKPFDPMFHEAMMSDTTSNLAPGTVTSELQRGYMMHGRVLRPARVTVAAEPPDSSDEA